MLSTNNPPLHFQGLMQKDSDRKMDLIKKYFDKSQWFFLLVRIGQGHSAQVVLCYQFLLIVYELIQRKDERQQYQ